MQGRKIKPSRHKSSDIIVIVTEQNLIGNRLHSLANALSSNFHICVSASLSNVVGLTKLKFLLGKKLAPATVLDGIELICGSGCGRERSEHILPTGWADPVHPKPHIYSKMALNLIEKVAASNSTPSSQKRARSESSEDASSSRGRQDRSGRGSGSRGGQQANPSNSSNTAYTAPGSSRSARGFQNSNNLTWTPPCRRARPRQLPQGRSASRRLEAAMEPLVDHVLPAPSDLTTPIPRKLRTRFL